MVVRNFSQSTITSYKAAILRVYGYFNLPLEGLTDHDLVRFVCHLKEEKGLSRASMRIAVASIKYFYKNVLGRWTQVENIPYPKKEKHIPAILSGKEMRSLFDNCPNLKHRLMLKLIYSAGLRRSEIIHLSPSDLDWENMQITVRQGKGNKDRHTVLARALRADYLLYTKQYEPGPFLFFGRDKNIPITPSLLRWAMDKAIERAGITKNVHLHSLRHSFASHLLSLNTDIVTLQKLLGHEDIRTTMVYLHLNHRPNNEPRSPLDIIYK